MKFDYIILGTNQRKTESGFVAGGDWTLIKCFVSNPRGYGEFYLNLNQKTGEGEIVFKDTNYGDFLGKEFEMEMKGIWEDVEELDREAEKYEVPAYLRRKN